MSDDWVQAVLRLLDEYGDACNDMHFAENEQRIGDARRLAKMADEKRAAIEVETRRMESDCVNWEAAFDSVETENAALRSENKALRKNTVALKRKVEKFMQHWNTERHERVAEEVEAALQKLPDTEGGTPQ